MSTFSPEQSGTTTKSEPSRAARETSLLDHLSDLARRSEHRLEFFHRFSMELVDRFAATTVILHSPDWSRPITCSRDPKAIAHVDSEILSQLLQEASPSPTSCDLPLHPAAATESPRALRAELTPPPQRITGLIIYPARLRPTAIKQVDDMKQLRRYAEALQGALPHLPTRLPGGATRIDPPHKGDREPLHQPRALSTFHHSLDPSETSYRIVNESRRMFGCDRVTVLVPKGSRFRVASVSGVSVIDRRSNTIRYLEQFVNTAAVLDRRLEIPEGEMLPPQVQEAFDRYQDESAVASAIVIPIHCPNTKESEEDQPASRRSRQVKPVGMLVLESFSGEPLVAPENVVRLVAEEAGIALRNSLEHRAVFGLRFWKALGKVIQLVRHPILMLGIVCVAAILATGLATPIEHHVIATGSVEPATKRDLFAAVDGTVLQILVADGQQVKQGDVLIQLENTELENQAESLAGQIATTAGRLASIQAVRLSGSEQGVQESRLVLEERQLQSELANLRSQQEVVKLQLADLTINSPLDGTVVAWQIERRLQGRPVNRGNLLCSVADSTGPWKLRLTVPEKDAGAMIEAAKQSPSLDVRFAVATLPEKSFRASLDQYSYAARMNEAGIRVIDLVATVQDDPSGETAETLRQASLRVGADVTAKIACGERSAIRSWFSDVFDFVNRQLVFYVH